MLIKIFAESFWFRCFIYISVFANITFLFFTWQIIYDFARNYNSDKDSENKIEGITFKRLSNGKVEPTHLICYYVVDENIKDENYNLSLKNVNANLCTHINIGPVTLESSALFISNSLDKVLREEVPLLKNGNQKLKILLWIGGGGIPGFSEMVKNHDSRKKFIGSVRDALRKYKLDGIDLDWEFPSAYNKERQHFSQLLYEIKAEYIREKRRYLLSVAVAAPESISVFAYDVRELNKYADFVNIMTYDFHFYAPTTPFTGLNAPLYVRESEGGIFGTLNINYSVNWWLSNGLDPKKLILGIPTYGHSFTLANPFNNKIGAPARSDGYCGSKGYTTYSDVCKFKLENPVSSIYDNATCSPYITAGTEWISYENEESVECKTRYAIAQGFGGVMVFSLNTDDFSLICNNTTKFPLIELIKRCLNL